MQLDDWRGKIEELARSPKPENQLAAKIVIVLASLNASEAAKVEAISAAFGVDMFLAQKALNALKFASLGNQLN